MSKEKPVKVIDTHNRPIQRLRALLLVCVVLFVVGGALLAAVMYGLRVDLDDANAERAQIRADLLEQRSAFAEANRRLVEAGERPVTPPLTGPQGVAGAQGATGQEGERGPRGPQGERGQTGSRGPRGFTGLDGTDGATVTGPRGKPGLTGAQGPAGPPGPQGPAGPPGEPGQAGVDGRGIASLVCQSVPQLTFTITFTDGTSRTVTCTLMDSSGRG